MLAAPVVNPGETKKMVYLPEGIWYDYLTGEKHEGSKWIIKEAPLDTCPVFVKAGTILPVWPKQAYVGEKDTDDTLELEVFPGNGEYDHIQDDGESFAYREGVYNQYHITATESGAVTVKLVHAGYPKAYSKVRIHCNGITKCVDLTEETTVMFGEKR